MIEFGSAWGPVLVWMAVIFIFSAQSHPPFVPGGSGLSYFIRKAGHFTEYAILAIVCRRAMGARRGAWLIVLILASVYAVSDEWHQSWVPGREALVGDWLIDSAGAAVGLFLAAQGRKIIRVPERAQ